MNEAQSTDHRADAAGGRTRLVQLSHTATRTHDMEATRRFYEDFLGLPMVATLVADYDAVTQAPSNYIHCFFQLEDGSCIAFFKLQDGFRGDHHVRTSDPYERHLAIRVNDRETVDDYGRRAEEFDIQSFIVDHDDFYSLYLLDPDGDQLEVTWHKPSLDGLLNEEAAHIMLVEWLANARKHTVSASAA